MASHSGNVESCTCPIPSVSRPIQLCKWFVLHCPVDTAPTHIHIGCWTLHFAMLTHRTCPSLQVHQQPPCILMWWSWSRARPNTCLFRSSGEGGVCEVQFVHGDLRLRNLAAKYVEGRIVSVIMLDLDWAGRHAVDRYLADINPSIAQFVQRPEGVQRGALMLQQHDRETVLLEYNAKVSERFMDMDPS